MYKTSGLIGILFTSAALLLSFSPRLQAQIEVPVSYELASGAPRIDGFLTGGSWCEPEGLSITKDGSSTSALVRYEDIDQLESLQMTSSNTISMTIRLKDAGNFSARATVPPAIPLMILRDEAASGTASDSGKIRTFTPENFRGMPLLEFEAAISEEVDPAAVKALAEKLGKAVEDGK
ncbi:MAG TPA: hypothetical protein PKM25_17910, partial [Candidatus Ozemobacteraceae bacterium]|nr:hypothetical protein [Candidatus Ozemobacteraceae bacterium]